MYLVTILYRIKSNDKIQHLGKMPTVIVGCKLLAHNKLLIV